jgi:hypothetical protein
LVGHRLRATVAGEVAIGGGNFFVGEVLRQSRLGDEPGDQVGEAWGFIDPLGLLDTVSFWVLEKMFSSLNSAKIRLFN